MSFKQRIQTDRQTFVCIINVNSSYCERESQNSHSTSEKKSIDYKKCDIVNLCNKESKKSGIVRKPLKISSRCYSRVPPACLRNNCLRRCPSIHRNFSSRYRNVNHHHRAHIRNYPKKTRTTVCEHKQNTNKLLSPISSSPFKDDLDYLYEDISTDSFDGIVEKPLSYKNGNTKICKRKRESKLDTLIRRTKERERRLVEQSRRKPWYTSDPEFYSSVSSEECLYSSISDVSTFILERRQQESEHSSREIYQKFAQEERQKFIHENCHNIKTEVNNLRNYPYSNSSPQEDFFSKLENFKIEKLKFEPMDKYEFNIGVKSEPMVDIETYSPITEYFPTISVKLEPKLDHNMTWIDNGIAMTDYHD